MAAVVRKINKKKNKLVSVLLIACILFQTCIYAPTVSAEDMSFAVATGNGYITFNGINVEYDTTLQEVSSDNLTGTLSEYILTLNLKSSYSAKKLNQSTFVAENGTYSVSKSGMYLIELWGGDGASVSGAGAGGEGGHIYATAHLEAGQTIFFTLGGNGRSSNKTYDGGGANGSGGDHGIVGNYTVGGGGGYSALFLYGAGEFESTYGSLKAKNISEEDRTSKYFMIAGGGGGGGANADYGVVAGKKANGGDGGSVVSPEGYVSGTGLVEGTYFAGSNGESTGSSTSYVGRGGTNVPGATADSLLGITDAKMTPPNNWFGTVGGIGGAGGSGELRGGGGGAGYAGGSGGLMTSVILASNVSGGGGGSSFIASNVNGQNTSYYIDNTHKEYLLPDNPSQDGGAVCITYLEVGNTDFLDDMKLSWCFSEYAMPIGGTLELYENGEKVEYVRAHPEDVIPEGKIAAICDVIDENHSHEKAILSHFSLLDKNGNVGGEFTASIKFTYTEHFMGGNNLPILNNHYKSASGTSYDVFYDAPMTLFANYGGEEHEAVFDIGKDCGYVNMPLRVHVHAHNQESNAPGTAFRVDSMFYDEFALPCYDNDGNPLGSIRDNLYKLNDPSHKDSYRYSQIKDIGNYQVYNTAGEELEATDYVYPNSTTTYRVALSVQMIPSHETGMALVGRGTKTDNEGWVYFSEPAVITVPGSRSEMLGKFLVHYQKKLAYTDGNYIYTLNLKSYADEKHNVNINDTALNHVKNFGEVPNQVEFDHVIETDGWYFIELWGGKGGAGGGGILGWSEGGSGGNGGYVSGFIELQRGDVIELFYGINGQRDNGGSFVAGNGGKHSRASLIRDGVETLIMIAGGGGGGGYGFIGDGSAGKQATVYTSNPNAESEYSAHDGKNGSNRTGGEAGPNYISPLVTQVTSLDDVDNVEAIKNNGEAKNKFTSKFNQGYDTKQHGGGAGHISCLVISESAKEDVIQEVSTALTQYGIEAEISKYFDVEEITFNRASASSKNVDENNVIRVTGIVPEVKSGLLSDGITATAEIDFDVVIKLSPKEGFMGGNDVPVICEPDDDLLHTNKLKLTHLQKHRVDETTDVDKTEEIYLGINDQADYANVDISYTAPVVEGVDQFYAPGNDAPIAKSALYNVKSGELPVINEGDEWKYDYVEIVNSITNLNNAQLENGETLSPIQTTAYEIAFGVRPKSPVAVKATVKDQQDGSVGTAYAVIIVGYEVLFELTELENNAEPIKNTSPIDKAIDKANDIDHIIVEGGEMIDDNIKMEHTIFDGGEIL